MENQTTSSSGLLSAAEAGAAFLPLLRQWLLGDLTASLLHDLNNPITAILNYARLLQMSPLQPEEIAEFARSIVAEGERMAAMTNRARPLMMELRREEHGAKLHEALALALAFNKARFHHDGIAAEMPDEPRLPNTKLALASLLQLILPALEQARQALQTLPPETARKLRCTLTESAAHQQRLTITHNGACSPEMGVNFLSAFFPYSPKPEQIQITAAMSRALLNQLCCHANSEIFENGWVALHLDFPAEI